MKKYLYFMNKEQGFFLPYILIIIMIVLTGVTSGIHAYKNTIGVTGNHLEEIHIETLFQMGRAKLKQDLRNQRERLDNNIQYNFPDGIVDINLNYMNEGMLKLQFKITTDRSQTEMTNYLIINEP
ncbi:hypothetical protein [Virgibacillus sediminis]|uniref:Uncharacterized protein n=1 Tax=Virgibacillus sediminis TaxID=202260 RepID=A0ABV7A5Q6_9BACI